MKYPHKLRSFEEFNYYKSLGKLHNNKKNILKLIEHIYIGKNKNMEEGSVPPNVHTLLLKVDAYLLSKKKKKNSSQPS